MGRPPGKIHNTPFSMRASEAFLKSIDKWRAKVGDAPSRDEAVRRLVEIGLANAQPAPRRGKKSAVKASELAGQIIDRLSDNSAPTEEREKRKRRLLKGPSEFRDMRSDRPKAKG